MKTRIPRKLKKRYKKMGIWSAYLNIASIPVMDEDEFRKAFEDFVLYGECRVDFSSRTPKALRMK